MGTDPASTLQNGLSDRYRIERELGRGGMAVVYLAHDLRHDRPVALKVLHPELAQALGSERFQREIHVAARLQHPHILTVLDSGETAGQFWFAMPFVEGESLRSRLNREMQLPVDEALRIAREAADALDYAHRHGIIHRDIKPDNILLSDGHALVADFGIARALASGDEHLTATGTSIGTAAYMSPEQAAGERGVDGRSDIYSLAVVLYEMLAGTTPFAAATPQASIARRFMEDAAPVRTLRATVPEHVERALQTALARTAADRFATSRAFADALGQQNIATPAAAPRPTVLTERVSPIERIRRTPAVLVLVVGVLIGVGVLFAWSRADGRAGDAVAATREASAEKSAVRIAVLPFENLGDSADAYFADGVTDAVRGKLAGIQGFAVIARASSQGYRGSTKPPGQIADELDVHYLLTGTVRWVKQPDGTSRVQVSPELVEIGDGTAHTRWGEPFNAPLTDVFEMQEQIAGRVSSALNVALGSSDQQRLAERPTADLEAYNLYLQAEAINDADPAGHRRAMTLLEQATGRDSTFALAWARLVTRAASIAASTTNPPPKEKVRQALDRAMRLAPDAPETHRARMGFTAAFEQDIARAAAIGEEAIHRHPNDPNLLRILGGYRLAQDSLAAGISLLERAAALDPRNVLTLRGLGGAQTLAGRFEEARGPIQRALDITPGSLSTVSGLMNTWLFAGDLAGARRVMNSAQPPTGRAAILAYKSMFGDDYWVLDRAQQDTVLGLGAEYFDGDTPSRNLVFAQILAARGDVSRARRHAADAAAAFKRSAETNPDPQIPGLAGLALAFAGQHAEAGQWLSRAWGMVEESKDAEIKGYILELRARAGMLAGDREAALRALEQWCAMTVTAPGRVRIHPEFAPLRNDPRFQRITSPARQTSPA